MVHSFIPQIFLEFEHFTKAPLEDLLYVMAPTRPRNTPQFLLVHNATRPEKPTKHSDKHVCKTQRKPSKDVTANDFTVKIDVRDFKLEEIAVKLIRDNMLCVEAKHETQDVEHGYVFKHVVKKVTVPEGFDLDKMASKLTTDGTLAITAPRIVQERKTDEEKEKDIPIYRED